MAIGCGQLFLCGGIGIPTCWHFWYGISRDGIVGGLNPGESRQDFRIGSGILSVSAQSTGLQVFVRGKFRGYTPLVVREVETGRCQVELRDKAGKNVLGTKEVIVSNSSVPVDVRF